VIATGGGSLKAVGLMCGTSVDAVDAAVVEIGGSGATLVVDLVAFHSTPVAASLRRRILQACMPGGGNTRLLCELNAEIGHAFAQAALAAIAAAGLTAAEIDVIGSHGQTVWHQGRPENEEVGSTLQLGEPCIIAEHTGITTVADFRPRDMAASGQGAPLVSYLDWALYRSTTAGRALQNIGGIANVTVLPPDCRPADVFAFDTGPGNMLIDALAHLASGGALNYDQDGRLAQAGHADPVLVAQILAHPFFNLAPPRTAGREQFGVAYAHGVWRDAMARGITAADAVATATLVTARSIAAAYRRWILPRVTLEAMYLSGGGARNPALVAALREALPEVPPRPLSDLGGDMQAKEAVAFAVLAAETLRNVPTSFPGATGARHPSVLGKIVPGTNWRRLQHLLAGSDTEQGTGGTVTTPAAEPAHAAGVESPGQTRSPMPDKVLRFPSQPRPGQVTIGIDGGGTKTAAVALDSSGSVVARAGAGPSNVKAAGWSAATGALRTVLERVAEALPPLTAIVGVHAALAGAGRPEDARPIQEYLLGLRSVPSLRPLLKGLPDDGVGVSNDAVAVLAAARVATGIVVIAGTGSLIWGCNAAGDTARAGGWGYLLGDEGSGFDLGRRALMTILADHDHRVPPSPLSAALLQHLGLAAPPELVGRIYGGADARTDIAGLASIVLRHMEAGDTTATALVQESVEHLAGQVRLVAGQLGYPAAACPVVCSGGLFQSYSFYSAVGQALNGAPGFGCVRPDRSPAEGAALLAWHALALAEGPPEGS
jgi:anhydro-N-acetylmuramic acid kinase